MNPFKKFVVKKNPRDIELEQEIMDTLDDKEKKKMEKELRKLKWLKWMPRKDDKGKKYGE